MIQSAVSGLLLEFLMISLLIVALIPPILLFMKAMARRKQGDGLGTMRAYDSSITTRVILDSSSGQECLVNGPASQTFREACIDDWPFDSIGKREPWIIRDDRGNDVSDLPLSEYNGIATISLPLGHQRSEPGEDEDMESSVTFYD